MWLGRPSEALIAVVAEFGQPRHVPATAPAAGRLRSDKAPVKFRRLNGDASLVRWDAGVSVLALGIQALLSDRRRWADERTDFLMESLRERGPAPLVSPFAIRSA